ncbi:MAG: hypothetical protein H6625_06760 [Bdellovibrionaceae bacterium]|nr:hypothetical protein [Pseudobdellovibrionaceae bacterium]MCB9093227.1 hypothetical protein [Halobacteriovoraceae bacterium]
MKKYLLICFVVFWCHNGYCKKELGVISNENSRKIANQMKQIFSIGYDKCKSVKKNLDDCSLFGIVGKFGYSSEPKEPSEKCFITKDGKIDVLGPSSRIYRLNLDGSIAKISGFSDDDIRFCKKLETASLRNDPNLCIIDSLFPKDLKASQSSRILTLSKARERALLIEKCIKHYPANTFLKVRGEIDPMECTFTTLQPKTAQPKPSVR